MTIKGTDTDSVFVHADNVTPFSASVTGLQPMNIPWCVEYAKQCCFNFNVTKSEYILIDPHLFHSSPCWFLDNASTETIKHMSLIASRTN